MSYYIITYMQCGIHQGATGLETIRCIVVASHLIGDMSGVTIDDSLFDRYKRLGCSMQPLEKDMHDYKMILKYLETTYEPIKVGELVSILLFMILIYRFIYGSKKMNTMMQTYGVSVESIYAC